MPLRDLSPERRPTCARCRRPTRVCYCAALSTLPTRTRVVILQHPRERDMPIGTARMASLCLPGAVLHVGRHWDGHAGLLAELGDPSRPPILLYPGEGARDILAEPPTGPVTLVVVDGTWAQAKTVVRDSPVLRALPRYAFATPEPSKYRIRSEPSDDVVSTIEALMHVLGVLEEDAARFRALLEPLHAMVEAQLACQATNPTPRVKRKRARKPMSARLPAALFQRPGDLVCLGAEANAWPFKEGAESPEELVHLVAVRVQGGERFEAVAAPEAALSPSTMTHTGLAEERLRAGMPRAELLARLGAFLRPDDVVCMWGHHALDLVRAAGGLAPGSALAWMPKDMVDLREAARSISQRKLGGIESYAQAFGPAPEPLGEGRAGRRLALLRQIVTAWQSS